jgi:hypothetical protein
MPVVFPEMTFGCAPANHILTAKEDLDSCLVGQCRSACRVKANVVCFNRVGIGSVIELYTNVVAGDDVSIRLCRSTDHVPRRQVAEEEGLDRDSRTCIAQLRRSGGIGTNQVSLDDVV